MLAYMPLRASVRYHSRRPTVAKVHDQVEGFTHTNWYSPQDTRAAREALEGERAAADAVQCALDAREAKLRDSWSALRAQLAALAGEERSLVPPR